MRRGQKPRGEYAEKSSTLSFRVRPDTRSLLEAAAKQSGRSLSQEAEHQLRRGLTEMRGPTHAILAVIGATLDRLFNLKDATKTWTDDPYMHKQAMAVVTTALEMFAPASGAPQGADELVEFGGKNQGRLAVLQTLREIQLVDDTVPIGRQTPHQRALTMLKRELGPLTERPKVYGWTAEQARQQHEIGKEFGPLMQKAKRDPNAITPADAKRLWVLAGQIAELQEQKEKGAPSIPMDEGTQQGNREERS
jgi:hypothetical protein